MSDSITTGMLLDTLEEILHSGSRYADKGTVSRVQYISDQLEKLSEEMYEADADFPGYAEEIAPRLNEIQCSLDKAWSMLDSAGLL